MENFRCRSSFWMVVTISFSKFNEKGKSHDVREQYVVEAASFIDAEQKIREEMNYNNRPVRVPAMVKPKFEEICFCNESDANNFYKVKVQVKEDREVRTKKGGTKIKTKTVTYYYLVQASCVEDAKTATNDVIYKDSAEDYEIADIVKTKIADVLENGKHLDMEKD